MTNEFKIGLSVWLVMFIILVSAFAWETRNRVCQIPSAINIKSGVTALSVRKTPVTGDVITTLAAQSGINILAVDPTTCWFKILTSKGEGWITNSTTWVEVVFATATPTKVAPATKTPAPVATPNDLLVDSNGLPWICDPSYEMAKDRPVVVWPNKVWESCIPVQQALQTPTRQVP